MCRKDQEAFARLALRLMRQGITIPSGLYGLDPSWITSVDYDMETRDKEPCLRVSFYVALPFAPATMTGLREWANDYGVEADSEEDAD